MYPTGARLRLTVNNEDLEKLEKRIDDLISVCRRLKTENRSLKLDNRNLSERHARLSEKTQVARERIVAMIDRLKALERSG